MECKNSHLKTLIFQSEKWCNRALTTLCMVTLYFTEYSTTLHEATLYRFLADSSDICWVTHS